MENIEVAVRIRPLNSRELFNSDDNVWQLESNMKTLTLNQVKLLQSPKSTQKIDKTLKNKMSNNQLNGFSGSSSPLNQTTQLSNQQYKQVTPNNQKQTNMINKALPTTPLGLSKQIQKQTISKSPIGRQPLFNDQKQQQLNSLYQQNNDKSPLNLKHKNTPSKQREELKKTMDNITCQDKMNQSSFRGSTPTYSQNSSFIQSSKVISGNINGQDPKKKVSYNFDLCFKEDDSNYQIYQSMVKRIALSSLNGINGTVFMYGQTGSGKTYSMLGRERKEIIPFFNQPQQSTNQQQQKSKRNGNIKDSNNEQSQKYCKNLSLSAFDTKTGEDMNMENNYLSGKSQEKVAAEKTNEQPGVLIYALQDLFKEIHNDQDKTYFLRCSYIEIYNEQVYDLLRAEDSLLSEPLHLNEDKNKDFYIRGVIEEPVTSIDEILYYLRRGELNRHYAETKLNHSSSRSHTLFRLQVQSITNNFLQQEQIQNIAQNLATPDKMNNQTFSISPQKILINPPNKDLRKYVTQSVLNFVDLAGSERVSSHYDNKEPDELFTTNFGDQVPTIDSNVKNRVNEGKNINKSLFFLTQVISMRAEGKTQQQQLLNSSTSPHKSLSQAQHIPYRNSPLTKILRSSLGGNARTCVIICITPAKSQVEQSLSSLRFGQNAMKIENKVQANIITNNNEEAVKILIADYERKIKSLEKAKRDVQKQREQESKIIEQLIEEKKKLIEKLNQQNLKKLNQNMQLNILESYIHIDKNKSEFEDTQKNVQILMQGVGLIEINNNIIKTIQHKQSNTENQNISDQNELAQYALHSQLELQKFLSEQQNQQIILQQEQIQSLVDCISELKSKNHYLEDQLTQASQLITEKLEQLDNDENDYKVLKMKEQFYESFNKSYIKSLEFEQVVNLEKQFTRCADICKQDVMKRAYREKINMIQEQVLKLKEQEDFLTKQDQFEGLQEALDLMQMSHDGNSLKEHIDNYKQQELCDHHRTVKISKDISQYSNQKNILATKLKNVQDQISSSINEHSYMNQVSEDNQLKINKIISRQSLIKNCEDKIKTIQNKFHSQYEYNSLNIVKSNKKQYQPLYQSLKNKSKMIRSTSQFKGKEDNSDLKQSFHSQRQTISLSPKPNQRELSLNKKSQGNIVNIKSNNISQQKQQKLNNNLSQENIDRCGSALQISNSFNKAISLIDQTDFKIKPTEQTFQADLNQTMNSMNYDQLTSVFNQSQLQTQNDCSNVNQKILNQFRTSQESEDLTQFRYSQENPLVQNQTIIERDNINHQLMLGSFAMTYRDSHPDIDSNNLFETLQNNNNSDSIIVRGDNCNISQHEIIVNQNDYVSFKQASDKKVEPLILDQVFGNERMSRSVLSQHSSCHDQQSSQQSHRSQQSVESSQYESLDKSNNQINCHNKNQSKDSLGILTMNFNKINIKDIDQIEQSIRQSLIEITSSLNYDGTSSHQHSVSIPNKNNKQINNENLQYYDAQVSKSTHLDLSKLKNNQNDIFMNSQRTSMTTTQKNDRNSMNSNISQQPLSQRQVKQTIIGKKADIKDYQPLLSSRNRGLQDQNIQKKQQQQQMKSTITPKKMSQ